MRNLLAMASAEWMVLPSSSAMGKDWEDLTGEPIIFFAYFQKLGELPFELKDEMRSSQEADLALLSTFFFRASRRLRRVLLARMGSLSQLENARLHSAIILKHSRVRPGWGDSLSSMFSPELKLKWV